MSAFIEKATRYYQIYDANDGRLLLQSPALEPLGLHYIPAEVQAFRESPRVYEMRTDQGRLHISSSVITPTPGEAYLLQVGVSLDRADLALERFERLLLLSVPLGLLAVIVAGRWMVGRALAPLVRLAAATRTISVANLQQRLPVRGAGDELDEVSLAFNDLLARQEQAIGEMRQFSAALAHELRTPLAVLRGETELALRRPGPLEEQRRRLTSQLEEFDKLSRLIGRLLTLARAESGEIPIARARVDLAACAVSIVEQLEPVAEARQIALSCESIGRRRRSSATPAGWNGCCSSCSTTRSSSRRNRAACRWSSHARVRRRGLTCATAAPASRRKPFRTCSNGSIEPIPRVRERGWRRAGTRAGQVDRGFAPRDHRGEEPAWRGEHLHRAPAAGASRYRSEPGLIKLVTPAHHEESRSHEGRLGYAFH